MTIEYKVCMKCGENKPATTEFFHKNGKTDGIRAACKVCLSQRGLDRKRPAYIRWRGMMTRCYDVKNSNYDRYGERGVTVCEDWKDYDVFSKWHVENSIEGWDIDKDILGGTIYSPEHCVFVPHAINIFFTFVKHPSVKKSYNKYTTCTHIKGKTLNLSADTEEDVLEQFYLFKELYLEKLVWEMKEEHKRLCVKYPNTPQISPKLLSILENFSTEEYLERKNSLIV